MKPSRLRPRAGLGKRLKGSRGWSSLHWRASPGSPHPGTREYLTCDSGQIALYVAGEEWVLGPGDVVSFRGDQRHSYANPGRGAAVGYSVVLLAPLAAR
ncbi:MAG: cupin domain-containing protein [Myxococcales bacterium]